MAYHLITSHLEGPTGVLVGNIQSFDSLKDLVDVTARKFTNKPLKLHEHDSVSSAFFCCLLPETELADTSGN